MDSRWDSGDAYEPYVGRWSRLVAQDFVSWLAVPPESHWLDVGCGTGALSQTIREFGAPGEVVGIDPSASYVASADARMGDDPRARFEVGEAQALRAPTGTFDAVVSGLVLNFVPRAELAVEEMARVVRPEGAVGAYVWDYAEGMQFMRHFWDAATELDPGAAALDEGARFSVATAGGLQAAFSAAGLTDVDVRSIEVPTVFPDFDDLWAPFLGGTAPGPAYVASLPEDRRRLLAERLRASLPSDPDGAIRLTARAWAVRGRRRG